MIDKEWKRESTKRKRNMEKATIINGLLHTDEK